LAIYLYGEQICALKNRQSLPGARLRVSTGSLQESTEVPHWRVAHDSPRRKATATRTASLSRRRPQEAIGKANTTSLRCGENLQP